MKIIFISYSEFSDKVYKEYFIDKFLDNNIVVEFWNITQIVRDKHVDNGFLNFKGLKVFDSYSKFKNELKKSISNDVRIFTNFPLKFKYYKFYRLLKLYNFRTYQINNFARPINIEKKSFIKKVTFHLFNPTFIFGILSHIIFIKFIKYFNLVNKFEIIFTSGYVESRSYDWVKKTININSIDFERSKENITKLLDYKYCVFFDVYLPYHNDIKLNNIKYLNANKYYKDLNQFFSKIENNLKMQVVICSHPTAFNNEKHFNGRPVFRMKTMELTKYAEFCLSHHSTSMSYAMIFKKPIFFIYNDEMETLYKNYYMRDLISLSNYTKMPLVKVNSEFFNFDKISISTKTYDKYIHDYVASKESQTNQSHNLIIKNL